MFRPFIFFIFQYLMPHSIHTFTNIWLIWHHVTIEVDKSKSLPGIEIIGLPDAAIKESKERIKASFRNSSAKLPNTKIILNLAPSNIRKVGTRFDLPLSAATLLLSMEPDDELLWFLSKCLMFGELWLDWSIRGVSGILPSVISAYKQGWRSFMIPAENINECKHIPNIHLYKLSTFQELINVYNKLETKDDLLVENCSFQIKTANNKSTKLSDIKWQLFAKRALTIAAAWMHNILMIWPPWSWKSLLAKSIPSLLPPMSFEQSLEVSQIYSLVWGLSEHDGLMRSRPFRLVHHTASKISITWGGKNLRPGEVSLAHQWVLFFDELPEFPREVLEVLRQPIEDKEISISRVSWTVRYPSRFMFVAAMNPCKCGYYQDKEKQCTCSNNEIQRYQSKISWPLLDRFDIIISVPREEIETILSEESGGKEEAYYEQVILAREIQKDRYKNSWIWSNSFLTPKRMDEIEMLSDAKTLLTQASKKLHLSTRVVHRTMKLARTIADLEWLKSVERSHIAESLQFRKKHHLF